MIFRKNGREIRRTRKIFQTLNLPQDGKIIDITCGSGRLLKTIENSNASLELHGVDMTPGYLALHPELSNITFTTAKADSIPYSDSNFDIAICSLSLHHFADIKAVLAELDRLTKPGGQIYLTDIIPDSKFSQKIYNFIRCREPYHFEKFYTQDEVATMLAKLGLKIINSTHVSYIPRVRTLIVSKN